MQQQTRGDWTGVMGPPVDGLYESPNATNFRYATHAAVHTMKHRLTGSSVNTSDRSDTESLSFSDFSNLKHSSTAIGPLRSHIQCSPSNASAGYNVHSMFDHNGLKYSAAVDSTYGQAAHAIHQPVQLDASSDYQVALLQTHPHKSTSTASTVSSGSDSSSPSHASIAGTFNLFTTSSSHNNHGGSATPTNASNFGSSKKCIDKASDEYKKRRERNNVAVRKSREKAKMRSRETERRVAELSKENQFYRAQYEELKREFNVLKSLLLKTGLTEQVIEEEAQRIHSTTSVQLNGLTSNGTVANITSGHTSDPTDTWANGPHAYLEEWADQ